MDFPFFHLDFFGNRMLIAVIAIVHVVINHALAVGITPLVATLELIGYKTGNKKYDEVAYKIMFVAFIVTTTVGALTGVGIWLSVSLVNPYSIGTLIRVFFWLWFFEWLVFCTEVCLILAYFLTWKKGNLDPAYKVKHIKLGYVLAVFSWITMAVVVAILAFMMDPGNWLTDKSFFSAVLNSLYIPQLCFRTPLSMLGGGCMAMFLTLCFTKRDLETRQLILRFLGLWVMFWVPFCLLGGFFYYTRVPPAMAELIPLSLMTGDFIAWHTKLLVMMVTCGTICVIIGQLAVVAPKYLYSFVPLIPCFVIVWLTGHFERVREFIRKPYVIGRYMYANGIRVDDYPLLQREGLLKHMAYLQPLNEEEKRNIDVKLLSKIEQGKNVFLMACSRCHTSNKGINGVTTQVRKLMGDGEWNKKDIADYVVNVHMIQSYMPPFPGNSEDADTLALYLIHLKDKQLRLNGAQSDGVKVNPYHKGKPAYSTKNDIIKENNLGSYLINLFYSMVNHSGNKKLN